MDKKTASSGTPRKCFSATYRKVTKSGKLLKYPGRREGYVYKFYLPSKLKFDLSPVDLGIIEHHQCHHDHVLLCNVDRGPKQTGIIVHYTDVQLKKQVSGKVVLQVMRAWARYQRDYRAKLSAEELRATLNLNTYLVTLEKTLLAECIRLTEEMEQRLRGGDLFLMDYEIPLSIRFFLRQDDQLIDKDDPFTFIEYNGGIFPEQSNNEMKNNPSLLCVVEELGSITAQEAADPDYSGLGDNSDYSESMGNAELSRVHHCGLFHELYDHRHIPLKHLGRIGRIEVDFEVWHQRQINLDLQGECPIVGGIDWAEFLPACLPKGGHVVTEKKNANGDAGGAHPFSAAKNKHMTPSVMVPFRFDGQFNAHFNWGRYVHKYYLPLDLKRQIRPADIRGIVSHYCGVDDGLDLGKGVIPQGLPDVTIDYGAYSLERRVSGATVRRVLLAYSHYLQDCGAELSSEEVRAALYLNEQLITLEKTLIDESVRLTGEMDLRLQADDPLLANYEITIEISFYLRNDDPFSQENNPDASDDDLDSDAALIFVVDDFKGKTTAREAADPDFTGLGDNRDHKAFKGDCKLARVRHCALFRELYEYCGVPMKHMGRIGMIWADFKVLHKGMVLLDLKGERPLARWLDRKEIESLDCYKSTLDVLDKFDQILYGGQARK